MYKFLPFFILLALLALNLITNYLENKRKCKELEQLHESNFVGVEFISYSLYRLMIYNIEELAPGKYCCEHRAIFKTPTICRAVELDSQASALLWLSEQS